jgi:hypothetical protein
MHRKDPLEKKGVAGMDALLAKVILTRRANQRHSFIIAQFVRPPMALPIRLAARVQAQDPDD